jgi:hypothetical protein
MSPTLQGRCKECLFSCLRNLSSTMMPLLAFNLYFIFYCFVCCFRIQAGQDMRTTVMIKNVPNKYSQRALLDVIDVNHSGKYDFFYLPIDFRNKCNLGYAFLNFTHPIYIVDFVVEFAGKRWDRYNSEKVRSARIRAALRSIQPTGWQGGLTVRGRCARCATGGSRAARGSSSTSAPRASCARRTSTAPCSSTRFAPPPAS